MAKPANGPRVLMRVEHAAPGAAAPGLRRLARRFLRALGLPEAELSLVLTTDARVRGLNRRWRGKDRATDVLSFPAAPHPGQSGRNLGDVVISLDTARRRAAREGSPAGRELGRYLAHGLLHLLGHDHHAPAQARRMARAEARLLGGAGMLDPSAEVAPASAGGRRPAAPTRPGATNPSRPGPADGPQRQRLAPRRPAPARGGLHGAGAAGRPQKAAPTPAQKKRSLR
jgi:probable rRNA maturation factor